MKIRSRLRMNHKLPARQKKLAGTLLALAAVAVAAPNLAIPAALAGWAAWSLHARRARSYPLRAPVGSGLDINDLDFIKGDPSPAPGILFLGHDKEDRELWLNEEDARQHFLVLGETGAEKTDALLGLSANALAWGSGFMFIDGKGDVSLFAKVFELCQKFGRTNDLLVLNFMNGNHEAVSLNPGVSRSHRINPFRKGSTTGLTQMLWDLVSSGPWIDPRWRVQSLEMLDAALTCLCWLRDNRGIDLDVSVVRDSLTLQGMMGFACDPELPEQQREKVRRFLSAIPSYDEARGGHQSIATQDHAGYITMQFSSVLGVMADVYGHIFLGEGTDIDLMDVVLNRRILVVMLPTLGRSREEVAYLGKILVAMLKGTMGALLNRSQTITWDDVVTNRPLPRKSPFLVVLDSVGSYAVEGMALMSAQARAIGLSMVYAENNIDDLVRLGEMEGMSIIANTATKILMRSNRGAADEVRLGLFGPPVGDRANFGSGEAVVVLRDRKVETKLFWCGRPRESRRHLMQLRAAPLLSLATATANVGVDNE